MWRRLDLPLGITFAQMAVILETALELPMSAEYEFEFFKEKDRLVEWEGAKSTPVGWEYTYRDAAKAAVDDWLMSKTRYTFRIRGAREDLPQYKVETEMNLDIDLVRDDGGAPEGDAGNAPGGDDRGAEGSKPHLFPMIVKQVSYKDNPYWSDPRALNEKLRTTCYLSEGKAEYPSHAAVIRQIAQGKGITCCQNIESLDNIRKQSTLAAVRELAEQIRQLQQEKEMLQKEINGREGLANGDVSPADDAYGLTTSDVPKLTREAPRPKAIKMDVLLKGYTKINLYMIAKDSGAEHVIAGKRTKAAMAYDLARHLLEPDVMRARLLELSESELDTFEAAISKERFVPTQEEWYKLIRAFKLCYLAKFTNKKVEVPADAAAVYEIICRKGYREYHRKARWLLDCLHTFAILYAVGSVNLLYKLYSRADSFEASREEFDTILARIPEWQNPCRKIGKRIVDKDAVRNEIYKRIEERRRDVPYYVPTKEEILEYSENGYPAADENYRKLSDFLRRELNIEEEECENLCYETFHILRMGGMLSDVMECINGMDVVFTSQKQAERFAGLIVDLTNHTRMYELKGHTPVEMRAFARNTPANVIPMMSKAGGDGKNGARKIYPNDPCPCGSGKKYKKCCERGK